MTLKPYSASVLAAAGLFLSSMGIYFIVFRPPLLPEDLTYMSSTMHYIKNNIPGLLNWLQKVFWVLGGFILTTGILIIFISLTSFRARVAGVFNVVALTGVSSIGLMVAVNFMIESDFKWVLLAFAILWACALILYQLHK